MKTASALIRLTRPANMAICAVSAATGALLGGKPLEQFLALFHADNIDSLHRILAAAASSALILAAGNVFNDIRDIETDKINAGHRPLVTGAISSGTAAILAVALALAGLAAAIPLGIPGISIAVSAVLLLSAYDIKLKGVPFAGNIAVSLLGGLAFVYGGVAGGCVTASFLPAVFAFLIHLGRELVKDAQDFEGDKAASIRTAATVFGVRTACSTAVFVLSVLGLLTLAPYALGYFGKSYIGIIALAVWPELGYAMKICLKENTPANLKRASQLLKLAMPFGLVAVLAGFSS